MQTPEMNRDFGCAHASPWPLDLNLDVVSHKFDKCSQMLQITNTQLVGHRKKWKKYTNKENRRNFWFP
jgi:predicted nucleotidyltransferase